MQFSSNLINEAVDAFAKLPGVGKKTALRLVLHLINQDVSMSQNLSTKILAMREGIQTCKSCFNVSDHEICEICTATKRDQKVICVVEDIKDIIAIENTGQYFGLYHVLGGMISPIDGIGPIDLNIDELINRVKEKEVEEIIMAVSPTIEGETTIFYISKKLKELNTKISTIARGVAFGGELQYTDEITLGRSIMSRVEYINS